MNQTQTINQFHKNEYGQTIILGKRNAIETDEYGRIVTFGGKVIQGKQSAIIASDCTFLGGEDYSHFMNNKGERVNKHHGHHKVPLSIQYSGARLHITHCTGPITISPEATKMAFNGTCDFTWTVNGKQHTIDDMTNVESINGIPLDRYKAILMKKNEAVRSVYLLRSGVGVKVVLMKHKT